MIKVILAIAALLIVVAACFWFGWNFSDYVITAWNWVTDAFQALLSGVPDWALPFFAAVLFIAFLGILVKVLG